MTYYGIFKDGNFIEKSTIQALIDVPDVEYLLRLEIKHPTYSFPRTYTLVHSNDSIRFLKIGIIELRDIGDVDYSHYTRKNTSKITLYDTRTEKTYQTSITIETPKFLKDELIPLMEKINEIGSYTGYLQSLEIETLKLENQKLKTEVQSLLESSNSNKD